MKYLYLTIPAILILFIGKVNSQTEAKKNFELGKQYETVYKYDSAAYFYDIAYKKYVENGDLPEQINAKLNYANALSNLGMFDKAKNILDSLLIISKDKFGGNDSLSGSILHKYGIMYFYMGKMAEALEYTEKGLRVREEILHFGHPELMNSHNNLSLLLFYSAKYDECLEHDESLLKQLIAKYGEKNPEVANYYSSIGDVKNRIGEYSEARYNYNKSLEIYKLLYGEEHEMVASAYFNLGMVLAELGKFEKSIEYQLRYAQKTKELYGEYNRNLASAYNNIGATYWEWGNYEVSLDFLQKSFDIKKNLYGEHHPEMAEAYLNFGIIYDEKGDYDKALYYYNKTKEVYDEVYEPSSIEYAKVYNNMGISYQYKGEFGLSLEYFFKSYNLKLKHLSNSHIQLKSALNNIATAYFEKGDYQIALDYFYNSLEEVKAYYNDEHFIIGDTYFNIANCYDKLGKYDKAIEYLKKSKVIREKVYGNNHIDVAINMQVMGNIYHKQKKEELAEEHLKKSIELAKGVLKSKNPKLSHIYNNYGEFLIDNSRYEEALSFIQKSIVNNARKYQSKGIYGLPYSDDIYHTNYLLASVSLRNKALRAIHAKKGAPQLLLMALQGYHYCDTLINKARQSRISQADKIDLASASTSVYESAIETCYELYKVKKEDKYLHSAFYFMEKNKAGVLLEALASSEAQSFAGIPDLLLDEEKKLKGDIAFLNKKIAEKPDSALELRIRNKLFELNREYESLIIEFEQEYPAYHELKYSTLDLSIEKMQEKLDDTTAIISYFVGNSSIYISMVSKDDMELYAIPKYDDFEAFISMYRNEILQVKKDDNGFLARLSHKLYKDLLPFELEEKIMNLIIIPDGTLSLIPFESLIGEKPGEKLTFAELDFLVKRYNISYSYSANLLYRTSPKSSEDKIEVTPLDKWLAIAPVFSNENTNSPTERSLGIINQLDELGTLRNDSYSRLIRDAKISPLPGTEKEVNTISSFFADRDLKVETKLHEFANEDLLKSEEISEYNYLHIATHGFVNAAKPELSGILLSQSKNSKEDGILFTGEIYNLDINADLTVLSACETGLGKISKGEGIIGLSRALLYAGSKNIIVSLWKVADNSTSDLMSSFYKYLLEQNTENKSFSKAISDAKREMIMTDKYAHPYYWSPFILVGK